jgi:hypothetical protein
MSNSKLLSRVRLTLVSATAFTNVGKGRVLLAGTSHALITSSRRARLRAVPVPAVAARAYEEAPSARRPRAAKEKERGQASRRLVAADTRSRFNTFGGRSVTTSQ